MRRERPVQRKLSFYRRLSAPQRREYDRSDERTMLPLRPAPELGRATTEVLTALGTGRPATVRRAAQALADALWRRLAGEPRSGPAPTIKVLRTRPRRAGAEFHGLYTQFKDGRSEIKVWMLTAAHGQVVRPRTFLRTLLHEVCHHVDVTLLDLPSSFHTLGFHARESSLVRALERSGAEIPGGRSPAAAAAKPPPAPPRKKRPSPAPPALQLDLFQRRRFQRP